MTIKLSRLTAVGFSLAGKWLLSERGLEMELNPVIAAKKNVLYAFVVNGALMYIGKTATLFRARMQAYKTPASNAERGGSTNIKNNRNIVGALLKGNSVDIYALFDQIQQSHGEFIVNLAAGLEDNLIRELTPPWNGRPQAAVTTVVTSTYNSLPPAPNPISEIAPSPNVRASTGPSRVAVQGLTPLAIVKHAQARTEPRLSKSDFQLTLRQALAEATRAGESYVDVTSGGLHRRVGGYPGKGHSMPTCCSAMRDEMRIGDDILAAPPKGNGATLVVRYRFARE